MLGLKCLLWDPGSGSIISPGFPVVWPNGIVRAYCHYDQLGANGRMHSVPRFEKHRAPAYGCTCGIYGYDRLSLIEGFGEAPNWQNFMIPRLFTVLLAGYGRVVEHALGWRAEEAEILAIGPVPGIDGYARWGGREAATAIGVPYFETAIDLCAHARKIPRPLVES